MGKRTPRKDVYKRQDMENTQHGDSASPANPPRQQKSCRQKTGQQLSIKWKEPMQEIIEKYDIGDTPYLLPIIKNNMLFPFPIIVRVFF